MSKKLIYLISFVLVLSLVGVASGTEGLLGEYYHSSGGGPPSDPWRTLVMERIDTTVNFNWGTGSPEPGVVNTDGYAVRWTGMIEVPSSETYTFHTQTDDGVQLWVNNQLVIENWTDHGNTHDSGDIALTAGQKYEIKLEWYENGGDAMCELSWSSPTLARETIPSQYLSVERPYARDPEPADGALLTDTWVNLGWRAGDFAVSHDWYIGDNFDDVNDGTPAAFQGNLPLTSTTLIVGVFGFPYPDALVPGTTYYWRIDEVNDTDPNSPWKGPVWSFWIPPYTAYDPHPPDGAEFIKTDVELSWMAGLDVRMNTVYFGDNFDDVNSAVDGLQQADTTYSPGTLELDKTYYWRVDEFDGFATHTGDVLSFKTQPHIPITDPNLIGWWKLDGVASGTTVVDWSGYDHHGTIMGDPEWVCGYDGDALELDGDGDYVDVGSVGIRGMDPRTLAGWVRASTRDIPSWTTVFGFAHDGSGDGTYFDIEVDNTGHYGIYVYGWGAIICNVDTRWHHFAATYDGSGGIWYLDGQRIDSLVGPIATIDEVRIGARLSNTNYFPGLVDDVRIYNKVLTQNEIREIMRGDPELAYDPGPGKGSMVDVIEATPLSWLPGEKAAQHDVYFGTDKDAVADANTSDTTGIYRGRQVGTSHTPSEGVEWGGGSYYWRIDEYNTDATISKGNVWTFMVTDFIKIDDFEDYNDFEPDTIFDRWIDGWGVDTNGSEVGYAEPDFPAGEHFVETNIVHGGSQSMPYFYDTNFKYSEATYSPTQRDWTEEGVEILSLWFYGDEANAAARMYVALNGGTAVYHGDLNAPLIDTWTEWTIELQEFTGVNLTNVNTLAIGFGDKNNLQAGGTGFVLFDDIRLYRPAPEPEPQP